MLNAGHCIEVEKGSKGLVFIFCGFEFSVKHVNFNFKGENNAREVSDALPFVEYEIHRQLLNKLRVKGMNALFGLKINIALNDRTIVAVATATGFFVAALPSPR